MTSNSQSTKSLGQVAFEAYFKQRFGTDCDWSSEERHGAHPAWQAAAEAVIGSVDVRPDVAFTRGFKKGREETEARYRAVIEAAKVWAAEIGHFGALTPQGQAVCEAVEALQEVE